MDPKAFGKKLGGGKPLFQMTVTRRIIGFGVPKKGKPKSIHPSDHKTPSTTDMAKDKDARGAKAT